MYLKNIKQTTSRLLKSNYYRNAFTLISGSVIAQLFLFGITPVLSRIFTPEDFGLYASFLAVVGILSILATFRYELAILLPEKSREAMHVFILATIISVIFSLFIFLFVPLIKNFEWIREVTKINSTVILIFIPLGIFLYDLTKTSSYLANRNKNYNWLSYGRIFGSVVTGVLSVLFGGLGWAATGLVFAKIIGWVAEAMAFLFPSRKSMLKAIP